MHEDARLIGRVALATALALCAGCRGASAIDAGTDAGVDLGPHAQLEWRVRCEASGGCGAYPDRAVDAFDDEGGIDVSCRVSETATTRTLSFAALYRSEFGLAVDRAMFPRAGGSPTGTSCAAILIESSMPYVALCGGAAPSELQPCRISAVFTRDVDGHSLIEGEMFCVGASPYGATTPDRELTAPGDGPTAPMSPATFSLRDCVGYVPD